MKLINMRVRYMKKGEIWRNVYGYEYMVSNYGRIYSLHRHKLLSLITNHKGYKQIQLHKDGKRKMIEVHRIVAKAFPEICGEWFSGCEVDHIDTDRSNNNATNLRVCTRKDNMNNPLTIVHSVAARNKKVYQYDIDMNLINEYDSITIAADTLGISASGICNSCRMKYKTPIYKGFIWSYQKYSCTTECF